MRPDRVWEDRGGGHPGQYINPDIQDPDTGERTLQLNPGTGQEGQGRDPAVGLPCLPGATLVAVHGDTKSNVFSFPLHHERISLNCRRS